MTTFDELVKSREAARSAASPQGPNGLALLFLGAFLALLAFLFIGGGLHRAPHGDGQHQEQVQPAGGMLVLVHDHLSKTVDQDLMLREMPRWCPAHGLTEGETGFRAPDDQDPAIAPLVDYAAKKGISVPFVALLKNGKPLRVAAWPADMDALEKFVK